MCECKLDIKIFFRALNFAKFMLSETNFYLKIIRPVESMKAKIAVATVSGKAYYKLVNELKERGLLFLSLVPGETIPLAIKVVITTEKEKPLIKHPNVIVFNEDEDPKKAVNGAFRMSLGKDVYREVAVGVDPGKTFGVAVLCDGNILKTEEEPSLEGTIDIILSALKENPAETQIVRIGYGIPKLVEELIRRLRRTLPENTKVEIVSEEGTSHPGEKSHRGKLSDADSAVKIAQKRGSLNLGSRFNEAEC